MECNFQRFSTEMETCARSDSGDGSLLAKIFLHLPWNHIHMPSMHVLCIQNLWIFHFSHFFHSHSLRTGNSFLCLSDGGTHPPSLTMINFIWFLLIEVLTQKENRKWIESLNRRQMILLNFTISCNEPRRIRKHHHHPWRRCNCKTKTTIDGEALSSANNNHLRAHINQSKSTDANRRVHER